jgi:2-methylcitrate synthase
MSNNTMGLRGISAGNTAICTCGKDGVGLTYRGYDINDLATHSTFEEVAFLLTRGHLPTQQELTAYKNKLYPLRGVPQEVKKALQIIPGSAHPMDVLRTACSVLGCIEPETSHSQQLDISDRLLSFFPSALCYWVQYARNGKEIETTTKQDSLAGHFLELLNGKAPSDEHIKCMDVSLILYAEHEFNASTFTARVISATLPDFYSAVCGAIGALRGPLHGGANEAAMELIEQYATPEQASQGILSKLQNKDKIMGFGHAVYKINDPRNLVIKKWAEKLSHGHPNQHFYPVSEAIEKRMWDEKKLFPNLDFYSANTYHFMGIETDLFTPIFIISRISGWSAHIIEQRSDNRLIRPNAEYTGPTEQAYTDISQR